MLVSPDRPCESCNSIFWELKDDGRVCFDCGRFESETPLEDIMPGITAKILRARKQEAEGEDAES